MINGLTCQKLLDKIMLSVYSSLTAKSWTPFTYQTSEAQTVEFSLDFRGWQVKVACAQSEVWRDLVGASSLE